MLLRAADLPAPQQEEPDPDDPEPAETEKALAEVLNAVKGVQPESAGSGVREVEAAVMLLNFLRTDDAQDVSLTEQMQTWYQALDEQEQEAFNAAADSVLVLAQTIAKGDMTAEEVQVQLADSALILDPVDPQAFPHDLLIKFAEAVHALTAE